MLSYLSGRHPGPGAEGRPFAPTRPPLRGRSRSGLLLLALLTSACAGARLPPGIVTRDLGHGSRYELDQAVDAILHQAGYSVQRRSESGSVIYYETDWKTRKPFFDERDRGADLCRTRIIVEAHRERLNVYAVRLRAENAGRKREQGDWAPLVSSRKFQEHVDELASEITLRIDSGVRVY